MYSQDYSTSYVGTQIKILKTMMEAALDLGYNTNRDYTKKFFKKPTAETDSIFLDEEELKTIHDHSFDDSSTIVLNNGVKLTGNKLERAKDIFLISSFTDLRIGDAKRLRKENIITIKGKQYLQILSRKTTKPLSIPIHPTVLEILEKRKGEFPEKMPDQHINYALKKIGKIVDMDEEVDKKVTKGGRSLTEEFKKYELICTHTGRRSFCTNAYRAGVVAQDIMTISGHSTERSFMLYLKLGESQKAEKIGEHPFFN
jgi:integrase